MEAQSFLLLFLLFAAVAIGWMIGRSSIDEGRSGDALKDSYFKGLNYLIDEEPDAAIDTFIEALEVSEKTIESHFVLGQLLRKHGEPDRAIRVHQNLLARGGLSIEQRDRAKFELAQDFVNAGLIDRAARIYSELIKLSSSQAATSRDALLQIQLREQLWEDAIETLESSKERQFGLVRRDEKKGKLQAALSAQLAIEALAQQDNSKATHWLRVGLKYSTKSNYLGYAEVSYAIHVGDSEAAITRLLQLLEADRPRAAFYLSKLRELPLSSVQLKRYHELLKSLDEECPSILFRQEALYVDYCITRDRGRYLDELRHLTSKTLRLEPLRTLMAAELGAGEDTDQLALVTEVLDAYRESQYGYQCGSCGFKAKKMHWQCPSCRDWEVLVSKNELGVGL